MFRKDTVKRFYERGILPSPSQLMNPTGEGLDQTTDEKISITMRKYEKRKMLSPQDFIEYYNNKYETIRGILLKKMDAVSITNAKTDPSPCGIIGVVKERTPLGFIFEDPTGEMEVVKSGIGELERTNPDDVFGMRGFVRENRFFPKEIVWPDIPLNRRIGKIGGTSVSLSRKNPPEIIISERQSNQKRIQINKTPEWINISKGQDSVIILAFECKNTTRDDILFYLKRRSLPEPNPINSAENPYLIKEIPDIIWLIQDGEWLETYKGIIIISCGGKSTARVDLETREVGFEGV